MEDGLNAYRDLSQAVGAHRADGQRIIDGLTDAVEGRYRVAHVPGRPAWFSNMQDDLPAAIAELKAKLPGWYYSVCECQVSCDATIAPTRDSPDIGITYALPQGSPFDSGFDVALGQPSTLAQALRHVIAEALAAREALGTSTASPSSPNVTDPGKTTEGLNQ